MPTARRFSIWATLIVAVSSRAVWKPNIAGVASKFKYIVDKRVAQGFTVFQSEAIHVSHGGSHENSDEEAHCDLRDGLTDADLPGFANMDRKFAYLADCGMVHAHAGITWALEPVGNVNSTQAYMAHRRISASTSRPISTPSVYATRFCHEKTCPKTRWPKVV